MEITGRELVKPSSPTPAHRKHHKLSFLDQLAPSAYIPLLFFYRNGDLNSPENACHHLKQSLSETLTEFYPLAGKLTLPDLATVDCDDSGALFVEAKVDAPLSQATQDAPCDHFVRYLPLQPYPSTQVQVRKKNDVLLAVQITMFACGGCSVGVCMNHRLADLASCLTFLTSWAAISRGEYRLVRKPCFEVVIRLFPPLDYKTAGFSPVQEGGKVSVTRFVFSREKLIQLKQLASKVKKHPTGVEVVTAFLCEQFIVLKTNRENPFTFGHAVSLRGRISTLKDGDQECFPFGNVIISKRFSSSNSADAKADLVSLVTSGLGEVDEDYVLNSAIPWLHKFVSGTWSMKTPDWYFTSWCRCPMYEVDFGWGKPISAGPAAMPNRHLVTLTSTRNQEGIEALVGLLPSDLPLLSQDLLSLAARDIFPLN